jgi:hypothetical protein
MTPLDAILELLARMGASNGAAVLVSDEELSHWPAAAVKAMKMQKLLVKARPAASVVCPGCERECIMPVHTLPAGTRGSASFIACDKRSDINRVAVPIGRLQQWQASGTSIAEPLAGLLALRRPGARDTSTGRWEIGMFKGAKRSQMLCLKAAGELALVAGNNTVSLSDLSTIAMANTCSIRP